MKHSKFQMPSWFELNDLQESLEQALHSNRFDPIHSGTYIIGKVLLMQQKFGQVLDICNKALKHCPNNNDILSIQKQASKQYVEMKQREEQLKKDKFPSQQQMKDIEQVAGSVQYLTWGPV